MEEIGGDLKIKKFIIIKFSVYLIMLNKYIEKDMFYFLIYEKYFYGNMVNYGNGVWVGMVIIQVDELENVEFLRKL